METYDGQEVRDYGPDRCDTCQEHHEHIYGIGPEEYGDVLGLCTKCFKEYDESNRKFEEDFQKRMMEAELTCSMKGA